MNYANGLETRMSSRASVQDRTDATYGGLCEYQRGLLFDQLLGLRLLEFTAFPLPWNSNELGSDSRELRIIRSC
jgi:hypothetical protein